jgi:hypothetical protein
MTLLDFILSILNHGKTTLADADLERLCTRDRPAKFKTLYPLLYQELKKANHASIPGILMGARYNLHGGENNLIFDSSEGYF